MGKHVLKRSTLLLNDYLAQSSFFFFLGAPSPIAILPVLCLLVSLLNHILGRYAKFSTLSSAAGSAATQLKV